MVGIGVGADWCWGVGDVEGKWWVHGRDRARTEQALIATVLHTPNVRASVCMRKLAKLRLRRGPMSPRHRRGVGLRCRRGVGLRCRLRTHAHTHTICRARAHAHHAHMHTILQRGLSSTTCLPRSWPMHVRDRCHDCRRWRPQHPCTIMVITHMHNNAIVRTRRPGDDRLL